MQPESEQAPSEALQPVLLRESLALWRQLSVVLMELRFPREETASQEWFWFPIEPIRRV